MAPLQAQNQQLQSECTGLQGERQELKAQNQQLQTELQELRAQNQELRGRMTTHSIALSVLSVEDVGGIVFGKLCNPLEPRFAVAFCRASRELWGVVTQAARQQLKEQHEAAIALCRTVGMRSCQELRKAVQICWQWNGLTAAELALLGKLGSVLPALERLTISEGDGQQRKEMVRQRRHLQVGPDGVQRLMAGLEAGALPAVTMFQTTLMHMSDAGASELAAALCRGALPRLHTLNLNGNAIGDVGLAALARVLRRLPSLERLLLRRNPFGDKGLAALVAPPPAAGTPGALPPRTVLPKLKMLSLSETRIGDAGCAALVLALDSGALPALENITLKGILASAEAKRTVFSCWDTNPHQGAALLPGMRLAR